MEFHLQIQSAQTIDQGDKAEQVHFHVGVHRDTKILLDGFVQQIHSSGIVGEIQRPVFSSVNRQEHIPHKRSKPNRAGLFLYAAQDHGITAHLGFLTFSPVLADKKDVDDLAAVDRSDPIQTPVDPIPGILKGIQGARVGITGGIPVHAVQFVYDKGSCTQQEKYGQCNNQRDYEVEQGMCSVFMHEITSFGTMIAEQGRKRKKQSGVNEKE